MISKRDLKDYDLKTIEDYFEMVITSELNGNLAQTTKYICGMSKAQKKLFLLYVRRYEYTDMIKRIEQETLKQL